MAEAWELDDSTHGEGEQELVETGLASILDEAATVCERLSADERIGAHGGAELKDVLNVLHTMLDRAQELVGELTREVAAARRGRGPADVRAAIEEAIAGLRSRQETAIQTVRSHAEQVCNDLTWRVGMLGEQVEVMAASLDAAKALDAGAAANGAVATALGTFEREVGEFLTLFRERASKAGEAIEAAGRERERGVLTTVERAERAAQIVETIEAAGRDRECAVLALIERAERAVQAVEAIEAAARERERAMLATIERAERAAEQLKTEPVAVITPIAAKTELKPTAAPKGKKSGAKAVAKSTVTVKAKTRSVRAAA